jgi:uncharacterized protein YjgD (DUF1641 family)
MFVQVFASGTNVQRLAQCSQDISGVIYTAYSELEATEPSIIRRRFYCTEVQSLLDEVNSLPAEIQPSWNKIWGRPLANEAFVAGLLASLVGENELRPELNLEAISAEPLDCFMLLVSANKREMSQIAEISRRVIPAWHVKVLNGDFTSNRDAERQTRIELNRARLDGKRGMIILANQMGSRSYSVSEIQATVIAFDRGSVDATLQKVSRCLTPGKLWDGSVKTQGHILDLSFDPNRAENIEKIILDEAVQVQRAGTAPDFARAVKFVLSNINLFRVNQYGYPIEVTESDMFAVYSNNDIMLRVADISVDATAALESGVFDILNAVNAGSAADNRKKAVLGADAITAVKSGGDRKKRQLSDADTKRMQDIINAAIRALNMSATTVHYLAQAECESYRDCIIDIAKNNDAEFTEFYGISAKDVIKLLDLKVLNEAILDVIVQNSKPQTSDNLFA